MTVPENLIEKLQKILALTNSPMEGEAQAAAAMVQKLLTKYGLTMVDLEKKGAAAPGITKGGHDLGKAAFTWKLDLADAIADHYFCHPMINRASKTVSFIGRPENVESLKMLYAWLIDQIKRIAAEERKLQGQHIDPLRWQVNFGVGAVERLSTRLEEIKAGRQADANTMALMLHHSTEISDYLEEQYGYRTDGRNTKEQAKRRAEIKAYREAKEALLASDPDAYYKQYPYEHPDAVAALKAQYAKENADWVKREARNAKKRTGRAGPRVDWVKSDQAYEAKRAGRGAADRINLQPFVTGGTTNAPGSLPEGKKSH